MHYFYLYECAYPYMAIIKLFINKITDINMTLSSKEACVSVIYNIVN